MKTIERSYLETLKKVMGSPDIKIITGIRRSGKSVLLQSFEEYVAREITNANIIHIDFNNIRFEPLQEYHTLHDYIEEHYETGLQNFLFIDEVQMCPDFEKAINSLHNSRKYDIYLTGSNAFLLSSDLATLFRGRVFALEIFPFSFKEYLTYQNLNHPEATTDPSSLFNQYLLDGGFAGSYIYNDLPEKYRYIADLYDTMIIRDIEQKYNLKKSLLLQKVSDYLIDNTSRLTTGRTITNTLNSAHQDTSNKTIEAYLGYLCNAFAFYKVKRFDIQGKAYLRTQDKYYLCDHSIKYAKLGTKNFNYGNTYENIIAIELLRRGYEVYVGTLYDKEINFVAKRQDEKIYIQVSSNLAEEETFLREVSPLLKIRDAYPKLLIARTREPERQYEGIRILDIADWLLSD